jgi:hypothetical protein
MDLSEEEAAALTQELHDIAENARYPFSHCILTLGTILAKLRPDRVREPLTGTEGVCSATNDRSKKATGRLVTITFCA